MAQPVKLTRGNKSAPANGPVTVGTSAVQVLAANAWRKGAVIYNNGTVPVYIGRDNTVLTTNGIPLAAQASFNDTTSVDAWWAISGSAAQDVRVVEVA